MTIKFNFQAQPSRSVLPNVRPRHCLGYVRLPRTLKSDDLYITLHTDENKNKEGSAAVAEASKFLNYVFFANFPIKNIAEKV